MSLACIVNDFWKNSLLWKKIAVLHLSEGEVKPVPVRSKKEKKKKSPASEEGRGKLKFKDLAEHDHQGRQEFLYLKKKKNDAPVIWWEQKS